jgi:hypothetical protein
LLFFLGISMTIAYDLLTATAVISMAGNEFAVAAFVHPQLYKLSNACHAQVAPLLSASLGKWMPFWYGLCLALILGAAYEHRPLLRGAGLLITCAGVIWALTIVFTIAMLVPINNRIARMNPQQPHANWREDRSRWDRLHRIRVVLLFAAVLLLLAGLFGSL